MWTGPVARMACRRPARHSHGCTVTLVIAHLDTSHTLGHRTSTHAHMHHTQLCRPLQQAAGRRRPSFSRAAQPLLQILPPQPAVPVVPVVKPALSPMVAVVTWPGTATLLALADPAAAADHRRRSGGVSKRSTPAQLDEAARQRTTDKEAAQRRSLQTPCDRHAISHQAEHSRWPVEALWAVDAPGVTLPL